MHANCFVKATLLALVLTLAAPAAHAGDKDFDLVVRHIKEQYNAKKRDSLPFFARAVVRMAKPAGVKSLKVSTFDGLSGVDSSAGLASLLREKLDSSWTPIVRVFSRLEREQAYVYVRMTEKDFEVLVVSIDGDEATVVKAKLDPDAAADWFNDGAMLGRN